MLGTVGVLAAQGLAPQLAELCFDVITLSSHVDGVDHLRHGPAKTES